MSTNSRGPKYRCRRRAILTSSSGSCRPWTKSKIAFATYCPTQGSASSLPLSAGKTPRRNTISLARPRRPSARRRQSPIGRRRLPISLVSATASCRHPGYLRKNEPSKPATVSALVRCSKISVTTVRYLDNRFLRHGNRRPWIANHASKMRANRLTLALETPESLSRDRSLLKFKSSAGNRERSSVARRAIDSDHSSRTPRRGASAESGALENPLPLFRQVSRRFAVHATDP